MTRVTESLKVGTFLRHSVCCFVTVYLIAQFKSQLKFCLYTIVHVLLEEFRFSLKSYFVTQSVCHTLRPGVGVWFWAQSQSPGLLGPPGQWESGNRNFLTQESGVPQKRIPHPWSQHFHLQLNSLLKKHINLVKLNNMTPTATSTNHNETAVDKCTFNRI